MLILRGASPSSLVRGAVWDGFFEIARVLVRFDHVARIIVNLCRDLNQEPTNDRIRDGNLVNVAPLQLAEETLRIHGPAFATRRIYAQGCP